MRVASKVRTYGGDKDEGLPQGGLSFFVAHLLILY